MHRRTLPEDLARLVPAHRADALDPAQLEGACNDIDVVFSCLGASVSPEMGAGRRTYLDVDTPANRNLIEAAIAAGVRRFVYVSVAGHRQFAHLRYVQAHEAVADMLTERGMSHAVVRPHGLFSALAALLPMAAKGWLPVIGDGSARTNPIHDADLAEVCADAVEDGGGDRTVGGPEVLTRMGIAHLALDALGKPARTRSIPPAMARAMGLLIRPLNPRMADLTAFIAEVSTNDLVVPTSGTRTLGAYLAALARDQSAGSPGG